MENWIFDHAALAYVNQWYATDRDLIECLKIRGVKNENAIKRLASKYMVARCFKSKNGLWAEVEIEINGMLNKSLAPEDMVDELAGRLGAISPMKDASYLPSAASKFLWFNGKKSVRIYDRRAAKGLARLDRGFKKNGEYGDFLFSWNEAFEIFKPEIRHSLDELNSHLRWSIVPPGSHGLISLVTKRLWFEQRVFDKYLWLIGSEEGANFGSFM